MHYCYTHRCHGCHHCCPVAIPVPGYWCGVCRRYTSRQHFHDTNWFPWTPRPVVSPAIICGPQQRDAATIRALAG